MLSFLWKPIAILTGIEWEDGSPGLPLSQQERAKLGATLEKRYEAEYGPVHVPFFRGTFDQAKQEAKEKGGLLVACFTSSVHEASSLFLRETIGDPALAQFMDRDNVIVWIADAVSSAQCYDLASLFEVQRYPSCLFLASVEHRMIALRRIDGFCTASCLRDQTEALLTALMEHEMAMAERLQGLSTSQRLREEQDLAYQRSLEADAKKAREREEAERQRQIQREEEDFEKEQLAQLQSARDQELSSIRARIQSEYEEDDAVKLSLQLPDGQRFIRRFSPRDPMSTLYDWAFSLVGDDLHVQYDNLVIRTLLSPVIFERSTASLEDCGISTHMKLIIELKNN